MSMNHIPPYSGRKYSANLNKREKPYCCWAAWIALALASAALGCILGSVYCDSVTGGILR